MEKKVRVWKSLEKQEDYLRHMHKQGWALVRHARWTGTLIFESCEKEDVVYRCDYFHEGYVTEGYLNIYRDMGWEFVCQSGFNVVFRKKVADAQHPSELDLYSDVDSRFEVQKQRIRSMHVVAMIGLAWVGSSLIMNILSRGWTLKRFVTTLFFSVFYLVLEGVYRYRLSRLVKEMEDEKGM
ncbi:DUF2812 domain-containing protein [Streptococcus pneumoniae]